MKPVQLILKGYARNCGTAWVAVNLDFGLAAQGDNCDQAMRRLNEQILEYVYDALSGEDRQNAEYLLKRRAPLSQYITYYWIRFQLWLGPIQRLAKVFTTPMPMSPIGSHGH